MLSDLSIGLLRVKLDLTSIDVDKLPGHLNQVVKFEDLVGLRTAEVMPRAIAMLLAD